MFKPFLPKIDFIQLVKDFFQRVDYIEKNIITLLKDYSYKFDLYQKKFNIKHIVTSALSLSLFILIFGIFLPLFIEIYNTNHQHVKKFEIGLLVLTMLPYLFIILYYLKRILEMKIK